MTASQLTMKRQREKVKVGVHPAPKRRPKVALAASSDSEKPPAKPPRKRPDRTNLGSSRSKVPQSNNDAESQTAASSRAPTMSNRSNTALVELCQCCRASSALKKWVAVDLAGKVQGQQCEECALLHKHCFRYLEWPDMCQRYLDSGSQGSTYLPCVVVAQ